jgi:hypothetical protein
VSYPLSSLAGTGPRPEVRHDPPGILVPLAERARAVAVRAGELIMCFLASLAVVFLVLAAVTALALLVYSLAG